MTRKIIVAIDGQGLAAGTIPLVAAIAARAGAEVVAVHVRDIENELGSRKEATDVLESVVGELAAKGIHTVPEVRSIADGHPARAIAAAVRYHGAELVAIGSHGRNDLAAMLLGSVGHELATLVDVPILVVRPPTEASWFETAREAHIGRVLVAVSLDEPEATTRTAARVALEHDARVRLFHVKEAVTLAEGAAYIEPDADATQAVSAARQRLAALGIDAEMEIATGMGSAAREITTAADRWDADLIVLGSRRPSDLGGLLLGSVGHEVVHITRRPVLLAEKERTPVARSREVAR